MKCPLAVYFPDWIHSFVFTFSAAHFHVRWSLNSNVAFRTEQRESSMNHRIWLVRRAGKIPAVFCAEIGTAPGCRTLIPISSLFSACSNLILPVWLVSSRAQLFVRKTRKSPGSLHFSVQGVGLVFANSKFGMFKFLISRNDVWRICVAQVCTLNMAVLITTRHGFVYGRPGLNKPLCEMVLTYYSH